MEPYYCLSFKKGTINLLAFSTDYFNHPLPFPLIFVIVLHFLNNQISCAEDQNARPARRKILRNLPGKIHLWKLYQSALSQTMEIGWSIGRVVRKPCNFFCTFTVPVLQLNHRWQSSQFNQLCGGSHTYTFARRGQSSKLKYRGQSSNFYKLCGGRHTYAIAIDSSFHNLINSVEDIILTSLFIRWSRGDPLCLDSLVTTSRYRLRALALG